MKILLALALFSSLGFTSCTTLANRRDLFSPTRPGGPYTKRLEAMHPVRPIDHPYKP